MNIVKFLVLCGGTLLLWTFATAAELTPQQKEATENGIALFNQYRPAESELTIGASAGDSEAQFYLAEVIRKKNHYINEDSFKWYEASAKQENIYAMIRLARINSDLCALIKSCPKAERTPSEWLKDATTLAKSRARKGDGEAMYLMYHLSGDREWLKQSAEQGYGRAAYLMGIGDRQGEGFFLLPGQRESSVKQWMKISAEAGYPDGIMSYAAILAQHGDMQSYVKLSVKAAEAGDAHAVFNLACDFAHESNETDTPLDLVKAYGLMSLVAELDGGGGMQELVAEIYPKIKAKMSEQKIAQGKAFASEWRQTHPPLSFFPDKLDG